jgi:hypothetical protein
LSDWLGCVGVCTSASPDAADAEAIAKGGVAGVGLFASGSSGATVTSVTGMAASKADG